MNEHLEVELLAVELLALINNEISLDPDMIVDRNTDLLLTGVVDSLGVVQVVDWMEQRTGTDIDPSDVVIENFQTVALMLSFLENRKTTAS